MIRLLTALVTLIGVLSVPAAEGSAGEGPAGEGPAGEAPAHLDGDAAFSRIGIWREGRPMPMDSAARHYLLEFSGREKLGDESAADWMARVLFAPESTGDDPVFLIEHPEVAEALSLSRLERDRFSFKELEPSIPTLRELVDAARQIDAEERSLVEKGFLQLDHNLQQYLALRISFLFAMPRPEFTVTQPVLRELVGLEDGATQASFWALMRAGRQLGGLIEQLEGVPREQWTPAQVEALTLSSRLFEWSQQLRGLPLLIIPVPDSEEKLWLSPWDALGSQLGVPEVRDLLDQLATSVEAWQEQDQAGFDAALERLRVDQEALTSAPKLWSKVDMELDYNRSRWFFKAKATYILAVLSALFLVSFPRRLTWIIAGVFFGLSLYLHTGGILQRMLIMGRPPVTNLYATFLFVGWVIALIGTIMEVLTRRGLGLLLGSLCAVMLLFVSMRWAADGDTMTALVPVLNSNFWLSTHVICIMLGYSGTFFAGLCGAAHLVFRTFRGPRHPLTRLSAQLTYATVAFGLSFSFFGTMLGGVWADQSWGRFWGWDPKENGALLIVLWLGATLHARMGGMIRERGLAIGAVLGINVLLFAWLGTNLLGVGLHSYGFTTGVKLALNLAMLGVVLFALVFGIVSGRKVRPTPSAGV